MIRRSTQPSVLLVGVVPPPYHGQSLATLALFEADLAPLRVSRVGINSSKELGQVGKASFGKAFDLLKILLRVGKAWLRDRPLVLYYTAGSGAWVPFIRDVIFLCVCRPLFGKTIIHYHSGDLVDFISRSTLRKILGSWIYGRGAWTIKLGDGCPAPDYPSNRIFTVPNGIQTPPSLSPRTDSQTFRVLFLGNLFEDKGVIDLIDALGDLALLSKSPIQLSLVGSWPDETTRNQVESRLSQLPPHVSFAPPAPAYGEAKWELLRQHDVLVFPSRYRRENLPLVIIEAMAAGLPVIATRWRGIPSIVSNGETGTLVPVSDRQALTRALADMQGDTVGRASMGHRAQSIYRERFTLDSFINRMRDIFLKAADPRQKSTANNPETS